MSLKRKEMGICDKTEKMELANKQQHHQFKDKMAQRIVDFGYVVRSWESHRRPQMFIR